MTDVHYRCRMGLASEPGLSLEQIKNGYMCLFVLELAPGINHLRGFEESICPPCFARHGQDGSSLMIADLMSMCQSHKLATGLHKLEIDTLVPPMTNCEPLSRAHSPTNSTDCQVDGGSLIPLLGSLLGSSLIPLLGFDVGLWRLHFSLHISVSARTHQATNIGPLHFDND